MPLHPSWQDIAVRLLLTLVAGAVIGFNRERGHAAGLRTTMLMCLAASVAMIEANLLLGTTGKAPDSFTAMDVLRFPLGILSGVGFIGAGAILRRGAMVTGVTTAATLWTVTVIGLCLGSGELALGIAATVLSGFILWMLKQLELFIAHNRRATLIVKSNGEAPLEPVVQAALAPAGYRATTMGMTYASEPRSTTMRFEVRWKDTQESAPPSAVLKQLEGRSDITLLAWTD